MDDYSTNLYYELIISKRLTEIKKSLISLSNEQDRLENYLEKLRESKTSIK